jgi:DnaJ-class molecular chaperone
MEQPLDSVVTAIIQKFKDRAIVGKAKYGTDLDRKDLEVHDWITHAQEELMDAILYLEKLKRVTNHTCKWCSGTGREPNKPKWSCTMCHGDTYM